jgi:Na+/proline symporter
MRILSPADVSAGLPASAAASALLGKSGAAALLVLLFLAVTSATSAELIAVSSILTYDVYKVPKPLLRQARADLAPLRDTSTPRRRRRRFYASAT